ncbi:MAG: hypothetical protein VX915_02350 [Pseudomonadota bacterium]|nr:hypothetical protein [Pseudomonadota bacterium]
MKFSTKTQVKTHRKFLGLRSSSVMFLVASKYVNEFFTQHAIAAEEYSKAQDFLMLAKGSLNHHSVSRAIDFFFQNLPSRKHSDIAPQQLTELAMGHTGRKGLRRLAAYLVDFHEPKIKQLFLNYENHTPIFYTIAEFLAQKTITKNDTKLLSKLIKLGNNDDLVAYSYLYAFKYVACTKPDLLVIDLVEPYINKVYELIPIVSIFVSLAFEGNPKALEIKSNEFWSPIWEYNRREILCLQAALAFKNLIKSAPAEASDIVALYRQQAKILRELNSREKNHRPLLADYWRLHLRIDDLELLLPSVLDSVDFAKWAFVLLTSYHWEVAETSAEYFAANLDPNSQGWRLILQWAFNTNHPAAWACIVAVQIKARETDEEESLFACLKLHAEAKDAQLRGNAAHLLYQLLCTFNDDELKINISKILPLIKRGLEDNDIWAIEESLTSNELLTSRGFQSTIPSNDSLLGGISNWQKLSDEQLSEALKLRKTGCRT